MKNEGIKICEIQRYLRGNDRSIGEKYLECKEVEWEMETTYTK